MTPAQHTPTSKDAKRKCVAATLALTALADSPVSEKERKRENHDITIGSTRSAGGSYDIWRNEPQLILGWHRQGILDEAGPGSSNMTYLTR